MSQNRAAGNILKTIKMLGFFVVVSGFLIVGIAEADAKQDRKVLTTISTGTELIEKEFTPEIKKAAVTMALKVSVEKAVSELLAPEVFALNLETLHKRVLSNPSKYTLNYSVVAELTQEKKYVAAVKSRIDMPLLKKNLKRYGVIKNSRKKPTILLLISEQTEDDVLPKYWWGKNPLPYDSLVSNEIIRLMTTDEFIFAGKDPGKIDLTKYGIIFNSIYDNQAAVKLASKLKADIVVTGSAKSFEALNRMGEEKIFEADIALTILNAKNGRQIGSFESKATANNFYRAEGMKAALVKSGEIAADEITKSANKYWEENILKKDQMIETRIEGENYLSSFISLRKALNEMPDVKSVRTKELGADQAVVNILFKGNADKLAQAILLKTFDSFGIEIYDVKDKSFTIKFVSK